MQSDREILNMLGKGEEVGEEFFRERISNLYPSLANKPVGISWRNYYLTIVRCKNSENGRFLNKVVLVTGGTSGIGLATAIEFAKEGASVIVCGRRESKWLEVERSIEQQIRQRIEYRYCDIRIESNVKDLIDYIFEKYGRLDVAFNNAGVQPGVVTGSNSGFITDLFLDSFVAPDGSVTYSIPPPQPSSFKNLKENSEIPATQASNASPFRESEIATSCIGTFYCMKWEVAYAFDRGTPLCVINTSSRNGVLPDSHRPLYAASKAFILSLTRSVSNQVATRCIKENRTMIRINSISPGPIDTPLEFAAYGVDGPTPAYVKNASVGVPMHRTGRVSEIAPTVLFLADDEKSSYITGANISIDGGNTASPLLCPCDI